MAYSPRHNHCLGSVRIQLDWILVLFGCLENFLNHLTSGDISLATLRAEVEPSDVLLKYLLVYSRTSPQQQVPIRGSRYIKRGLACLF